MKDVLICLQVMPKVNPLKGTNKNSAQIFFLKKILH